MLAPSLWAAEGRKSLLNEILRYDAILLGAEQTGVARQHAALLETRVQSCQSEADECILEILLADDTLSAIASASSPFENSATSALTQRGGSCAALVAVILALGESTASPFKAMILRQHVVLTSGGNRYFEVLDGGRRLAQAELNRHQPDPPVGIVTVGGWEYLPYYLDNLAARLADAGKHDRADAAFQEALKRAPNAARIRYNYGTFLFQQGAYVDAERELRKSMSLGWKDAAAFVNRGATRWKLGRLKAARRDFKRALQLDPKNREATTNLQRLEQLLKQAR